MTSRRQPPGGVAPTPARAVALALLLAAGTATGLDLEPCEIRGTGGVGLVAAQCGRLEVAEDPDEPAGRVIELFVARVPALAKEPRDDALTVINGGPGASSVSLYVDMKAAFSGIRRNRDIVVVDQRGTGRSAPLDCPEMQIMGAAPAPGELGRATRQCLEATEQDPRFYTTSFAVDDLERVREALGYAAWNLYGVSYGTRVAQEYLRRYPASVRTAILDGVVPPDQALGPDLAVNAQATLDALLARCAGDTACAAAFPDLEAQFRRLARRLEASPVALTLPHPVTARRRSMKLSYGHLALTVRMSSYAPETAALIPVMIREAVEHDNFRPIASQALRLEHELAETMAFGMHNSVVCSEDVPFYPEPEVLRGTLRETYLGAAQVEALRAICRVWPRGRREPAARAPLRAEHPVLLLSGEHDPITPPAYARRAAQTLPNSRHLLAPGQGHGVVGRGCMPWLVSGFVGTADPAGLDPTCLERLDSDAFFVDLMGPPP
ncbi:MAG: alpha/beta hydrolase [Pseudomonadota bacterium]